MVKTSGPRWESLRKFWKLLPDKGFPVVELRSETEGHPRNAQA